MQFGAVADIYMAKFIHEITEILISKGGEKNYKLSIGRKKACNYIVYNR